MQQLHLVMPMGGRGSRFQTEAQNYPKPMIQLHGKPFFYWATESIRNHIPLSGLTFIVLQEHIDQYGIDQCVRSYYPEAQIYSILEVLNGAVLTSLEAAKHVPKDTPVLFNDCDHFFSCSSFNNFCIAEQFNAIDGGLLTFNSVEPVYSYLQYRDDGYVCRTVEKSPISNHAICGSYYFKNIQTFETAASAYLDNCSYAEYFMSGVYNVLADKSKTIKGFATDFHISFGVPEEYEKAMTAKEFKLYD